MSVPERLIAGRYRLVRLVGSGGMAVVWEAWDERLHRRVAAKQLRLPPTLTDSEADVAAQRAMREARITARLHHRHAVPVFDVVDDDGRPCLIMQFLPSMSLAALLQEGGPLAPHEAAQVGAEVASALAAAHELGIVHRDVKPGNVLITDDGSALISDFGISHALGDITLTATGVVHGTPAYLSPEAARGQESTFASDVFGLGATLYAALEGDPPFGTDQNSIALLHRVAAGAYEPPRRSGPVTPLLLQMLSAEPSARPSMKVVATQLQELAAAATAVRTPEPAAPAPPPAAPPRVMSRDQSSPRSAADEPTGTAQPVGPATYDPPAAPVPPPQPVTAVAATVVAPTQDARQPVRRTERRRVGRVLVAVTLVIAVGLLVALLGPRLIGRGPGTVAQPPATSTTTAAGPSSSAGGPTSAASSAPPSSASSDETTATSTSSSPAPTRTRSPAKSSRTAEDLTGAITSYYALVPGDTDQAWSRMTADYQTNHAGGRRAYEQFWGDVRRVEARNVTATLPDRAEATLTYYYEDGRVVVEQTSYRLVQEGKTLKIAESTVLSSSTQ